ncbi:MAG: hypothetical protein JJ975_16910, partial [Bacteroidia bacterium]|nr:hypothetical protein [Bacteroidia bacterium]
MLGACAPKNDLDLLSVEGMHEDVDYLENSLKKNHPGLYWHSSQEEVELAFEQLRAAIEQPLSEPEFLQEVGKLNAVIKCVHSDIRPSETYYKWITDSSYYIPIGVGFYNGKYHVTFNASGLK